MTKPLVFVSHSSQDRDFVESSVLPVLKDEGIPFWYSDADLLEGPYPQEINKALKECPFFLVVASPNAAVSEWVKDEVTVALEHKKKVFVTQIEDCALEEIHPRLFRQHYGNFSRNREYARGLLRTWAASIAKAQHKPVDLVLSVIGARGGVGKSTLACRAAEMIAETGHNVLIVDLDTGTGGITALTTTRTGGTGRAVSVYEILEAEAFSHSLPEHLKFAQEVTPLYLSNHEGSGRVFLVPATPEGGGMGRPMFEILTKIEQSDGGAKYGSILDLVLEKAINDIEATVHCIILDCGAEGEEFNPFITVANSRSRLIYVVVQPDQVCPVNVQRIKQLCNQGGGGSAGSKLRLVINRVFSAHHEPLARASFGGFTVAGCIYDDREYFSAIQRGHVNIEDYDTISRGIQEVLAHRKEIPPGMVPTEDDLWARKLARQAMASNFGGISRLFQQVMGKGAALTLVAGSLLGAVGSISAWLAAARQFFPRLSPDFLAGIPMVALLIIAALTIGIAIALAINWKARRTEIRRQVNLLNEIDQLVKSAQKPYGAILDYVRKLGQDPSDARLKLLRNLGKAMAPDKGRLSVTYQEIS